MTHKFLKKPLFVKIAVLLFVGWIILKVAPSFAQSNNIPAAVNSCIPKAQVAGTEPIGSTVAQGKNYYLLAAYEQGDPIASDLIISIAKKSCRREFYNPTGDRLALASAVPQIVARQLTLQRYQREIKRIDRTAFEQQVKQSRSDRWFDEEAWALQQLHIRSGKASQ
ncbi:hypothetical protein LEP3755_64720 (plasmid) [Leptolyngbya sp. NIES-3755]|nr:hypothetical protein LEP3755_64720 [Leptolyngbya sp. NIES-3755]